jgi:threonine dehydrogenase-like Zn-dependent dehydrogenase
MKAGAVLPKTQGLSIIDHAEPGITRPSRIKLRVLEVGICGTDKEVCSYSYGTPPEGSDYLILGHECLGEVLEVGGGVSGITAGDLAVLMVRRPCPHPACLACRSGNSDFCATEATFWSGVLRASMVSWPSTWSTTQAM